MRKESCSFAPLAICSAITLEYDAIASVAFFMPLNFDDIDSNPLNPAFQEFTEDCQMVKSYSNAQAKYYRSYLPKCELFSDYNLAGYLYKVKVYLVSSQCNRYEVKTVNSEVDDVTTRQYTRLLLSRAVGRGNNDLGRGSNDLGRGSHDLGSGMLIYKLSNS